MDWSIKQILVTGGASFIGSHLVDRLVERGARSIRVVDDLSSGEIENIQGHLARGSVQFFSYDLLAPGAADAAVDGVDVVFHLAAIHGGRGYVELHQAECAQNLTLDGALIAAARRAGVEKFVFASSGCVYPNYVQQDPGQQLYLTEEMAGPPYDADGMYGWAKLMAEMTLRACHRTYGMNAVSCRFFTVYGERGVENHAVMAMIARAFVGQDPFEVWGDGTQLRNWTYVGDIVDGMILCAQKVGDGCAVNLGTMERTSVLEAAREVLRYTGHDVEIRFLPDMPTGPLNRIASNALGRRLLGWEPKMKFVDGLHRTIDWYVSNKDPAHVRSYLERMLTGRGQRALAGEPLR
ncbi:MAG: NAD-dependent epimerase/dehydratase family protein [Candidatus Dormibacteraeota bacterium]|nr:NAD-dependent epimerase/dehydratase family protein [Candidatus Dormibacteraeota bacterium]